MKMSFIMGLIYVLSLYMDKCLQKEIFNNVLDHFVI